MILFEQPFFIFTAWLEEFYFALMLQYHDETVGDRKCDLVFPAKGDAACIFRNSSRLCPAYYINVSPWTVFPRRF